MTMSPQNEDRNQRFRIDLWATIAAYALALLMLILATELHAQPLTVIHDFVGTDGSQPGAGLTIDQAGNF
jgi:hypothetical protein